VSIFEIGCDREKLKGPIGVNHSAVIPVDDLK
jgi:hypothetical protein